MKKPSQASAVESWLMSVDKWKCQCLTITRAEQGAMMLLKQGLTGKPV